MLAFARENVLAVDWSLLFMLNLIAMSILGTSAAFALWFSLLHTSSISHLNVFAVLTPIFGEQLRAKELTGICWSLLEIFAVTHPARPATVTTAGVGSNPHRGG